MSKSVAVKPEILETPDLELTIESTLKKNNVTEAVILALKDKYGGLKLASLQDKEGYIEIKNARKEVRKVGIITEDICKKGREDAIRIQKLWLSKEKDVLAKIDEVQKPLDAEIKRFEDEVARIEQEEAERKEQEYMSRQTILLKMEAKYENNCLTLGAVSYETANIKEADIEIWQETILPKYRREFEKIESVRAEEERQKEAAAQKLREEQAELERKQKEFEEKQRQFELQQAELQRKQDEADRIEREQKEKEANTIRERQDARNKARMQEVLSLGLNYSGQYKSFVYGDVAVAETDIVTYNEADWAKMIEDITPVIKTQKEAAEKLAEEKRQAEIEVAQQEAIKKEQEKIAEQNRLDELKKKQEEQLRQEELSKASDKDKWALYVQQIVALQPPVFTSNIYKGKANIAKEKIEEISKL